MFGLGLAPLALALALALTPTLTLTLPPSPNPNPSPNLTQGFVVAPDPRRSSKAATKAAAHDRARAAPAPRRLGAAFAAARRGPRAWTEAAFA